MHKDDLEILSTGPHHIAVFKPHNLLVVAGRGGKQTTLLDLMRKKFGKNIFPVHRLDRATSGITIFARSIFAKHAIENAFKKRIVKKTYLALVEGKPDFKKIKVENRLKKVSIKSSKSGPETKQVEDKNGDLATTIFRVLKTFDNNFTLIEASPISGRMHQIRVHLAGLGFPIVGDKLYGGKPYEKKHTIALCATKLILPLPKGAKLELDAQDRFCPENFIG